MEKLFTDNEMGVLQKQIKEDALAAPQSVKDIFCKDWPTAKAVIDALLKIITNPIAKLVLNGVEAIGDAAQKAICPSSK